MPKISDYELEHMTFDQTFEKFRRKSKPLKEVKYSEKKKHREKKIDF